MNILCTACCVLKVLFVDIFCRWNHASSSNTLLPVAFIVILPSHVLQST